MQKLPQLAPAAVLLSFLFITATLSAATPPGQMQVRPFSHNGYSRPYLLYRPLHAPRDPAVVVMLGGITSTAQSASQEFGWSALADQSGFLVVFPDPVRTNLTQPPNQEKNITFWEMRGSRTHVLAPGSQPVDDDGYLLAVLHDVVRRDHPDRSRIFFAGFSSGSGMAQLFASRHPEMVSGVVAVATPLMEPPVRLARPVPILYIHGDKDEPFTGFETHSPNFATTPHGNWVTWGYLDGCQKQTAKKMAWGVQFSWEGCRQGVRVIADFVAGVSHQWEGSRWWVTHGQQAPAPLNFTDAAWQFLAGVRPH